MYIALRTSMDLAICRLLFICRNTTHTIIGTRRMLHTANGGLYAGHSKWANIRHIKAEKDGAKAAMIAKLSRQIRLAVQEGGGGDPQLNSVLRSCIDIALRNNMPLATIENNIKRCQQTKENLKKYTLQLRNKQIFYVCVLYTDNLAQLKIDMASIVRKAGATFVDAAHLFDNFGFIQTTYLKKDSKKSLEDLAMEVAIECGAEDVEVTDAAEGKVNFICSPLQLKVVSKAIDAMGFAIDQADHIYTAKQTIALPPSDQKAHETLVKKLRDLPGMDEVYDNVEIEQT